MHVEGTGAGGTRPNDEAVPIVMLILDDPLLLAPDPADECPEHQVQREHTWESTRIDARRRFWTVRECLDRLIPLGERQFRGALAEFVATTTVSLIIKALNGDSWADGPRGQPKTSLAYSSIAARRRR